MKYGITYKTVPLDIEADIYRGNGEPDDPDEIEITRVEAGGVDILPLLSESDVEELRYLVSGQ